MTETISWSRQHERLGRARPPTSLSAALVPIVIALLALAGSCCCHGSPAARVAARQADELAQGGESAPIAPAIPDPSARPGLGQRRPNQGPVAAAPRPASSRCAVRLPGHRARDGARCEDLRAPSARRRRPRRGARSDHDRRPRPRHQRNLSARPGVLRGSRAAPPCPQRRLDGEPNPDVRHPAGQSRIRRPATLHQRREAQRGRGPLWTVRPGAAYATCRTVR